MTLLALALLAACPGTDDTGSTTGTTTGTGTTSTTTSTSTGVVDQDHDGWFSDVDCDDNDAQVHPEATEACDEQDNDCDDIADEGFDADGDGYLPEGTVCPHGDDCDDTDRFVHPTAAETPYDGVDQDCVDGDLVDVDGDGYVGEQAGGNDCDDANSGVHPGAVEVPKDGIDQDCSGADSLDGDGDGYDDEKLGGDDCDDTDPALNPGAIDWHEDGVDSDCDGRDRGELSLDTWPATISTGDDSLPGLGGALCDLDDDGLADVVVGFPFEEPAVSYTGAVGVWYGSGWSTWTRDMDLTAADVSILGDETFDFFGMSMACADFDGDGHMDLAVATGEYDDTSTVDKNVRIAVFYGRGGKLGSGMTMSDGDVVWEYEYTVPDNVAVQGVYQMEMVGADLDGDGASELVMLAGWHDESTTESDTFFVVAGGQRYGGVGDFLDDVTWSTSRDDLWGTARWNASGDVTGDGTADLLAFSPWWAPDTGDSGSWGQVNVLGAPMTWAGSYATDSLLALDGVEELGLFGWDGLVGDFDGDGVDDLVVSGLNVRATSAELAGSLLLHKDAASLSAGVDPVATADSAVDGASEAGYLGWLLKPIGDVDGDGTEDLLATEPNGSGLRGVIYIVSGARLAAGGELRDSFLLSWEGPSTPEGIGAVVYTGGDVDGDGIQDAMFAAFTDTNYTGPVYLAVSAWW